MFVEATASFVNLSPCFGLKSGYKHKFSRVSVKCIGTAPDSSVLESEYPVKVNGVSLNDRVESLKDVERIGSYKSRVKEEKLEPLWDDGYGTQSVKDYLDLAKDIIKRDDGPPRWFCPVVADGNDSPLPDSPVLLFLPGMDGLGLGLILHQKSLRKVFEVRCMHIPVYDRTPFEDLVTFVEETLRFEHALCPSRPIYLVGDSFGGCLALAVAARNPTIDLVVILSNPATSFDKTQLQPILPVLELMPDSLTVAIPYLLSTVMGDPIKMAMVDTESSRVPNLEKLAENLTSLLPRLSGLSDIIPKATLSWKLKLLKSAAAYTNSRLHAVKAEVLLLVSGKDNMLPSSDEAQRLSRSLQNCKVCYFKDNGHTLLLEDGVNLLTIIKGKLKYRRSWKHDFVKDYVPPSMSEYKSAVDSHGWLQFATSPVMFSTLEDGKIVRGLSGVPDDGPVLLVGYHMLLGLELVPLVLEFLREKNVIVRGIAHPELFTMNSANGLQEFSYFDLMKVFGALPVTPSNLFKLFSSKSFALLYPGGAREALHRKGEEYKLFWPDQPEFVRMAAKFGATIVPFGAVGEDDVAELVLDYDDIMKIPVLNDYVKKQNEEGIRLRTDMEGEVANQDFYPPGLLPKLPGRFYYLFGKPIRTKGREKMLKDRENAKELYMEIKTEVEQSMAYLIKKREEDPYRRIVDRVINQPVSTPLHQVPTFEP
ncbi:phytyl ester synthase 1, chloroplastic-like isoform X2 [Rutidosis leptorrhynchoides]|uniref:phytyl ester synthase 1, chloroplastic-like isoform X2 n=1 Tax=Rutidosis leptorrhynchoides TaxID=125765 RepID=UPI003A99EA92